MSDAAIAKETGFASRLITLLLIHLRRLRETIVDRSGRVKARRMVLIQKLELGNRRQLFLVACDEHRFLVGAGGDRIGTLVAMPTTASAALSGESAPPFNTQPIAPERSPARRMDPAWLRRSSSVAVGTHGLQLIRRASETSCRGDAPNGVEAGRKQ